MNYSCEKCPGKKGNFCIIHNYQNAVIPCTDFKLEFELETTVDKAKLDLIKEVINHRRNIDERERFIKDNRSEREKQTSRLTHILQAIDRNRVKNKQDKGEVICPVCGGIITYILAGKNKHLHASCNGTCETSIMQ